MKKVLLQIIMILCWTLPVSAQNLIPATSEDLNEFDRQVSESLTSRGEVISQEAQKGREFGQAVAAEAKKLGGGIKGPIIKAERLKNKEAKASSPANNNRGNSSNAPGQKKK
jgi:hypothetical protein